MERQKPAFTVIELITVIAIIALLVGLLIPALSAVKTTARETKQRAQLTTIELALTAFKNDQGDYPPSFWPLPPAPGSDYCGAQKLTEALVGLDLLGFHPRSSFRASGRNDAGQYVYDANDPVLLGERKGPYLELATASVFRLGDISRVKPGLFRNMGRLLAPDTYVLCDVFGRKSITLTNGKNVKAGAPILYYRADTSAKTIRGIYRVEDNDELVALKEIQDGRGHPLCSGPWPAPFGNQMDFFYGGPNPLVGPIGYIQDPKITARPWPYRPDSFLLISAGADGIYGTPDDIRNFGD